MPFLQTIGLTQNEADIYELLLKLGEAPAAVILQEANLKRPTVYNTLNTLSQKGLVTATDKNKKIHFTPAPPAKLLEMAESQFANLERAKADIQSVIPALTTQYVTSVERPIVRIFEGVEGVKKAHMEILNERQEILAYVQINEEIDKQLEKFWPKYYAMRRKYNIFARVISPNTPGAKEYQKNDERELRLTRLIPSEKFPINLEKNIVGNKVAFFSHEAGKLVATIIENKAIAEAEVAAFELAWEKAAEYNKTL